MLIPRLVHFKTKVIGRSNILVPVQIWGSFAQLKNTKNEMNCCLVQSVPCFRLISDGLQPPVTLFRDYKVEDGWVNSVGVIL